jgi:hypothetical protein
LKASYAKNMKTPKRQTMIFFFWVTRR